MALRIAPHLLRAADNQVILPDVSDETVPVVDPRGLWSHWGFGTKWTVRHALAPAAWVSTASAPHSARVSGSALTLRLMCPLLMRLWTPFPSSSASLPPWFLLSDIASIHLVGVRGQCDRLSSEWPSWCLPVPWCGLVSYLPYLINSVTWCLLWLSAWVWEWCHLCCFFSPGRCYCDYSCEYNCTQYVERLRPTEEIMPVSIAYIDACPICSFVLFCFVLR